MPKRRIVPDSQLGARVAALKRSRTNRLKLRPLPPTEAKPPDSAMLPSALKRWRQSLNYSQAELAYHLGVSSWTISNWETGKHRIPATVTAAMATLRRFENPRLT